MQDRRGRIFLSYRRADSAAVVDHLYDRLVARYGRQCLFRDLDDIPLGQNFRSHVREELARCDIVLAVIGRNWSGGKAASASRIMRDNDPVRIELEVALESGALVIPLLVNGATIPSVDSLPRSLADLPDLNAATLGTGLDFEPNFASLVAKLDKSLRERGKTVVPRPDWLTPLLSAFTTLAVAPPLLLLSSILFGIPFSGGVVTLAVFLMTIAAAMAAALFAVDAILSGRVTWSQPQQRPFLSGAVLFTVAVPAFYWLGNQLVMSLPLRDPGTLGRQLLAEFRTARAARSALGEADFTRSREIVDAILAIDPDNGLAWYYAGEIARQSRADLFDAKGCFRGFAAGSDETIDTFQQDFFRYRDKDLRLGMAVAADWGTEICYEGQGYCPQRGAWIAHLLAHDNFVLAQQSKGTQRRAYLQSAAAFLEQAVRFQRPEGGQGFTQCLDSNVMQERVVADLAEDEASAPGP